MVYFTVRNVNNLNKILNNLGGLNYSVKGGVEQFGKAPHCVNVSAAVSEKEEDETS